MVVVGTLPIGVISSEIQVVVMVLEWSCGGGLGGALEGGLEGGLGWLNIE